MDQPMDQPMDQRGQAPTPFEMGWWGTGLGRYRACDSTYCFYAYDSLPPLPPLDGSLSWLGALPDELDQRMAIYRNPPEERGSLARLREDADRLGLVLPADFLRLMSSPELQDRVPSCTACYFELGERIAPCPGSPQGYILRFLTDQQAVLAWYLYLAPDGGYCVLASDYGLDEADEADGEDGEDGSPDAQAMEAQTRVCARSFEEFIYRFWLENTLWFKLSDRRQPQTLTPDERRYIAHYEGQGASQT